MPSNPNFLPIRGDFVGNFSLGWTPEFLSAHAASSDQQASRSASATTARKALRDEYIKALDTAISENPGIDSKSASALRAIAVDPLTTLPFLEYGLQLLPESVPGFISREVLSHRSLVKDCTETWTNATSRNVTQDRSNADKNAQKVVPKWYHYRCPLTGAGAVQGAHIVNVQATKSMESPVYFWRMLQIFWPLKDLETKTLEIVGQEHRNLLPLNPMAHHLWDRNKFGLRPIEHPTDPKTKIYLQVNWFEQRRGEIELENKKGAEPHASPLAVTDLLDIRRELKGATGVPGGECLQHGDVYMLQTSDCATCPLPDIHFLQMRYAVQQLFAGQQPPEALRIIFGGDAPDDEVDGPNPDEAYMPADWDNMIIDARELGILDAKEEEMWRRRILHMTYNRHLHEVRELEDSEDEDFDDDEYGVCG
ncbi:hypothetical protein B0J18DRAFT_77724 [Chaetomium sp. MPI-SDFR-AT-0129]|nr:hypothetical protein B0J18DRAFT_77724 [Chaetomium sp. MPI-SDFR-AT-0129]